MGSSLASGPGVDVLEGVLDGASDVRDVRAESLELALDGVGRWPVDIVVRALRVQRYNVTSKLHNYNTLYYLLTGVNLK